MGFWNKRIKDTKAIAKDIGVEEIKIKELKQGKREIGGETMEKVLNSIEKTKESKIEKQIRKAHIFEWYQNTDLTALREKFGYKTQKSLAKELGIAQGTLCELETKKKVAFCGSMQKVYDFFQNDFNKNIEEEELATEEVSQPEEVVMAVVEEEPVEEYEAFEEEELKVSELPSHSNNPMPEPLGWTMNEEERLKLGLKQLEARCVELENKNYKLERQIMMYEKLIERL